MTSPKPIRIAFLIPHTTYGGAETMAGNLLTYLPPHQFEIFLLAPAGQRLCDLCQERPISHIDWDFPDFPSTSFYWGERTIFNPLAACWMIMQTIWLALKIARWLKQNDIHWLYSASTQAHLINAFACRLVSTNCLWHFQEIVSPTLARGLGYIFINKLGHSFVQNIVASSQAIAHSLNLPQKTTVIFNSVDLLNFEFPASAKNVLREEYGLDTDVPLIGLVGRLTPWKGQKLLLAAAHKILRQGYSAYFFIVGSGVSPKYNFRAELDAVVQQLQLEGRVIFTGQRQDIPLIMNALDIVVVPSIEPEPFGMVAVEAMAAHKPVIGSDAGGLSEIIIPAETGLLFPLGDEEALATSIMQLITNKTKQELYGEQGYQRAQKYFSIEQAGQAFVNLLVRLHHV